MLKGAPVIMLVIRGRPYYFNKDRKWEVFQQWADQILVKKIDYVDYKTLNMIGAHIRVAVFVTEKDDDLS